MNKFKDLSESERVALLRAGKLNCEYLGSRSVWMTCTTSCFFDDGIYRIK